jgi:NitT/TauT family transport system substrate-binding protein
MPGYHLPYFAAVDAGVFRRHGLDVEILEPAPGPANALRVAAGGADLCLTSVVYYLRAWQEAGPLAARFVMVLAQRGHMAAYVVDGRPTATGRAPSEPQGLEGARLGGKTGSPFVTEYLAWARRHGLENVAITEVSYEEAMRGLGQGRCDVFADYFDLLPRVQRRNPGMPIRVLHFAEHGLDVYGSGLVAGEHIIRERPGVVEKVVTAIREALELTRQNPELGLAGLLARYPETEPAYALDGWRQSAKLIFGWEAERFGPGWFEPERWAETVRYEAEVHGLPVPPIEATYDTRFVAAHATI